MATTVCFAAMVLLGVFVWGSRPPYETLSAEGWAVMVVLFAVFILLLFEVAPAELVLWVSGTLLFLGGIISSTQALQGFGNSSTMLVATMFMVAFALEQSGVMQYLLPLLFGSPRHLAVAQARLLLPCALLSAFMNNTPLMAMITPLVERWCAQKGQPPTLFLMPLSFAIILGGLCSSIGTSTSITIIGLAQASIPGLSVPLFEVGKAGLPSGLVALFYVILFSRWLLPRAQPTSGSSSPSSSDSRADSPDSNHDPSDSGALVADLSLQSASGAMGVDPESPEPPASRCFLTLLAIPPRSSLIGSSCAESGIADIDDSAIRYLLREGRAEPLRTSSGILSHILAPGDVLAVESSLDSLPVLFDFAGIDIASRRLLETTPNRANRITVEAMVSNRSPDHAPLLESLDCAILAICFPASYSVYSPSTLSSTLSST
ncbi:MAG: SLC13 family permease, partial [archaeon]|nr:SLC13 family permease [archaeon]